MKKLYFVSILIVFINLSWSSTLQPAVYYKLTDLDRKNLVLSVDEHKIKPPYDTMVFKVKRSVILVPVKLTNYSDKPLTYFSMSCSDDVLFRVNNNELKALNQPCQYNVPINATLAPYQSRKYVIPVVLPKGYKREEKFEMGMNIFMNVEQLQNLQLYSLIINIET